MQEKAESINTKHRNILQKNGQRTFKDCIYEKVLTVFWKFDAKKWLNFYWNEIKVPHVLQKNFLAITTKIQTKNWRKSEKNYQNRISICTILWNKITSR